MTENKVKRDLKRDYYPESKEFIGIPYNKETSKRDYYYPEEKPKKIEKKVNNERETGKDYEKMAKEGEKFFLEYRNYPFLKRKAIITKINDKVILKQMSMYEKNADLKFLIEQKLK
jgi:hypothetical protein